MAEKINSLDALILKLNKATSVMKEEVRGALQKSVEKVQQTAVSKFGQYQPAVGPFPAWAVLSQQTIRQKLRAGAPGDDPLIGHYAGKRKNSVYPTILRNSIQAQVKGLVGYVGTNNPVGEWQEFGTRHIPPRPFLRPALYQEQEFIKEQFKGALAKTMLRSL
ncbi:hypothetical protein DNHGIG_25850 [Collibacillus ludicampi]|uniref:HK97 gp10 family phage protein n=1 Tax=Collibacillus ludicampi TaxID=2771369 RepID=A0AAV4LH28_9BACL|nr:HK97-gp10 family putative phage morphogenesis protein [Collibacillus ludicampi]GIM47036.1 hypothetical protein DNHGIG_25850 [Collibacillus ludicampi]